LGEALPDIRAVLDRLSGVATRSELAAAGVTEAALRRQLRGGALVPICRGAYTLAETLVAAAGVPAREHALAAAAAVHRAGTAATASHHSAAIIHGLELLTRPDPAVVTLTRSPHHSRSRSDRAGAVVHIADLPREQVTSRHGIRVTTVARTVIDLARTLPFVDGVVVADAALHASKTARPELGAVLAKCARWPGVRRAEHVTAFSDHRAGSALASVARVAFHEHGLPVPRLQAWAGDEKGIGRADFFWPEHRTIAVADGAGWPARPERRESQPGADSRRGDGDGRPGGADSRRGDGDGLLSRNDPCLSGAGFEVVHFTWHEIMARPWQVVASVRAAFARGGVRDQGRPGRLR
jgi:Transcriptional regulator, AbiEi antitoxin